MNVLIVGTTDRPEAATVAGRVARWLIAHGHHPVALALDAATLRVDAIETVTGVAADTGLVVSIGGDGTMLRAVALLEGADVPVLGVNVGLLGYLAEVEPAHAEAALARFFAHEVHIERRLVLDVVATTAAGRHAWRSLNEASFEKQHAGQTVRLRLHIDGAPFTTYQADGILVATPTGSTAYSLSARGPVISPEHQAILITPLAPHMLFDRSLVLRSDESVEIEVVGQRPVGLTVDGQEAVVLQPGDRVRCSASDRPAHFVRLESRRFHQVLKAKFGLADR
ncbi:MAG: NAD(+)/NADH kinase [Acidimicrobiia bacterium]